MFSLFLGLLLSSLLVLLVFFFEDFTANFVRSLSGSFAAEDGWRTWSRYSHSTKKQITLLITEQIKPQKLPKTRAPHDTLLCSSLPLAIGYTSSYSSYSLLFPIPRFHFFPSRWYCLNSSLNRVGVNRLIERVNPNRTVKPFYSTDGWHWLLNALRSGDSGGYTSSIGTTVYRNNSFRWETWCYWIAPPYLPILWIHLERGGRIVSTPTRLNNKESSSRHHC